MSRSDLALHFAASTVGWAEQELELTAGEIGRALGATRRTVQRWRERASVPSATHRQRLERLNQLRFLLETSFRDPGAAGQWMHTPVPALKGRTPLFAVTQGDLDAVIGVLAGLTAGAHR
jgi:uncharacterized protein (DUF2384 family)